MVFKFFLNTRAVLKIDGTTTGPGGVSHRSICTPLFPFRIGGKRDKSVLRSQAGMV